MLVKITPNDKGNPPGKLADAELHFTEGPLEGLNLVGFAIWERKDGTGRDVTWPAQQYPIRGKRIALALIQPVDRPEFQDRLRDLILSAYAQHTA